MPMRDMADRATTTEIQRRSFDIDEFEFRDNPETGGFTFEGVASVVGTPYEVRDQFGPYMETIKPGAFNKTLRDSKANVRLFVNHQHSGVPLATRSAGTLRIAADPHLRVSADLDPARSDVQIIRSAVTRGEMRQMSIGFLRIPARETWASDMSSVERGEVNLFEASIVDNAASPTTTAAFRSLDEWLTSLADIEMGEDELRRAIAYFSNMLPAPAANTFAERDAEWALRLAKKRHAPV